MTDTITNILERDMVAMWCEVNQELVCLPCWRASKVIGWQAVPAEAMDAIAKELGKTTCDRCGRAIGSESPSREDVTP